MRKLRILFTAAALLLTLSACSRTELPSKTAPESALPVTEPAPDTAEAAQYTAEAAPQEDEALESCSSLRLVLMEPFTGGWFEDETRGRFMRERVGALQPVVRALAGEYGAAFVPLQAMFDEYSRLVPAKELIWDGVHPTITGHELIARQWLGCVQARFGDAE